VVRDRRAGRGAAAAAATTAAAAETTPAAPAAGRARGADSSRILWLAGLYYLLAAVVVTMWLWRDPAGRVVAVDPYDSDQFAWFFRYDATAVAHLRLPALTTMGMNAPHGVNLMWNTPMLLPGVLLAPLTLLAGPQVSLTLLLTLGFAGSALAMFGVLRRWRASVPAAAIGGLVYGFSPALVQSAGGHYDLQFAVLPPLIVDAALRLATGRCGAGRRAALRCGALLGLLMAAQVFITEELLFDSGIVVAVMLAVLAASRPRLVAARIGDTLAGAAAAAGALAAVAGYPLWEQFFGPVRQHGSPFTPDYYKNDLAGFVRPSASMLLHTRASASFASAFQGGLPEYLAYLGWPMLILVVAAAAVLWRLLAVRAAAVAFAVLAVLSLGGTLLAGGHQHSIMLPWYWVQTLPVAGSAVPDRFSILADGAAAAVCAFGWDAAAARLAARPLAGRWSVWRPGRPGRAGGRGRAGRPGRRWRPGRWVLAGVALAAIVPLVPRPLPAALASPVPPGWTATFAALRLPPGSPVLVVPIPESAFTEPLRWQADTGVPSSLVGGYYIGPGKNGQAATDGSGLSEEGQYLNLLWTRSSSPDDATAALPAGHGAPSRAQMRAQLAAWKEAAVVAVTTRRSPLGEYLTSILGPPTSSTGAMMAWRLGRG
jgi:hypothetical protein